MADNFPHLPSPDAPPFQPQEDVLAWLKGRTLEELQAFEIREACGECRGSGRVAEGTCEACGGEGKMRRPRKLVPEALRYRNARGEQCEEPICFAIPREADYVRATKDAAIYVAREYGRDPKTFTPSEARELVGQLRFEAIDNAAIVSRCARSRKAPHGREYLLSVLIDSHDPQTIIDAFERLDILYRLFDTRVGEITEAQFWMIAAQIQTVKNTSPLDVHGAVLRSWFIRKAVSELATSRTSKSSTG